MIAKCYPHLIARAVRHVGIRFEGVAAGIHSLQIARCQLTHLANKMPGLFKRLIHVRIHIHDAARRRVNWINAFWNFWFSTRYRQRSERACPWHCTTTARTRDATASRITEYAIKLARHIIYLTGHKQTNSSPSFRGPSFTGLPRGKFFWDIKVYVDLDSETYPFWVPVSEFKLDIIPLQNPFLTSLKNYMVFPTTNPRSASQKSENCLARICQWRSWIRVEIFTLKI